MAEQGSAGLGRNRLDMETSLYLRQHKGNPVHWYGWCESAFSAAQERNVPIFLSSGYASCHWCHVMAGESFSDMETAAFLNQHFVSIKIDREERPDIDKYYMQALHFLGEQGGWPLTMFLTPEGMPFWGGTYFPKEAGYGRPDFLSVLREISRIYGEESDRVHVNVASLKQALEANFAGTPAGDGEGLTREDFVSIADRLVSATDTRYGGLRGAPKFPMVSLFSYLWSIAQDSDTSTPDTATPDRTATEKTPADMNLERRTRAEAAVLRFLERMSMGGIYDHLGGGFARYSVDAYWHVPHFEKMLYDNALIVGLMSEVWRRGGHSFLRDRVEATVGWVLREMLTSEGGFAASLDADSILSSGARQEGAYYVWDRDEIVSILGDEGADFCAAYGVRQEGNWEGKNILHCVHWQTLQDGWEGMSETDFSAARGALFDVRRNRRPPLRDDKILCDWNGLMIGALARAGVIFERADWLETAREVFSCLCGYLWKGERLYHSLCRGEVKYYATSEGYGAMLNAALSLYEGGCGVEYLSLAQEFAESLERLYADREGGGYFFTPSDGEDRITRMRMGTDDAIPNGHALIGLALAKLYALDGNEQWRRRYDAVLRAFSDAARTSPFAYTGFLSSARMSLRMTLGVFLAGEGQNGEDDSLLRAYIRHAPCGSTHHILGKERDMHVAPTHPAYGKSRIGSSPTLYICRYGRCFAPLTRASDVAGFLSNETELR